MKRMKLADQPSSALKKHKHEFTALWWHFGPHGRQDVHVHDCFREGCDVVIVGEGRDCDGDAAKHRRSNLNRREYLLKRA